MRSANAALRRLSGSDFAANWSGERQAPSIHSSPSKSIHIQPAVTAISQRDKPIAQAFDAMCSMHASPQFHFGDPLPETLQFHVSLRDARGRKTFRGRFSLFGFLTAVDFDLVTALHRTTPCWSLD
jgi:hypothetical protein